MDARAGWSCTGGVTPRASTSDTFLVFRRHGQAERQPTRGTADSKVDRTITATKVAITERAEAVIIAVTKTTKMSTIE